MVNKAAAEGVISFRGKSGLLTNTVPLEIYSIKEGVNPWKVPQKITATSCMQEGKGENVR